MLDRDGTNNRGPPRREEAVGLFDRTAFGLWRGRARRRRPRFVSMAG
jgi:hypothetical protein